MSAETARKISRSCRNCSYVKMIRAHSCLKPGWLWVWVWVWDSWITCAAVVRAIVKDTIRRNVSFNHKKRRRQKRRTTTRF